jgi:uroporphyrinogen-III synthase
MRVLVTRPAPDAALGAARLRALGHKAVISSVLEIGPTGAALPAGPFDALLLTSANALAPFAGGAPRALAAVPVLCVGERTADAARAAGFVMVSAARGDARDLARLTRESLPPRARLLYLTGVERKPDLEHALTDFAPTVVATYRAQPAAALTPEAIAALRSNRIDAVLHYSRKSAQIYAALARRAGLLPDALRPAQLCLSQDVAAGLDRELAGAIQIAASPDETSLLGLLRPARHSRRAIKP